MRIVFMGTPEFARKPLAYLNRTEHEILAVVTGMDKKAGRGHRMLSTPCKTEAEKHGIKVFTPKSLKSDQIYEDLKALNPDLFVVVAFRILPKRLFTLPKFGSINIHASLLPRYRGAAPINWALIKGETETGLTSFYLKTKVDTGDIISQEKVPVEPEDNFDSLYARLSEATGPFLVHTLDLISSGKQDPVRQDDAAASPAPKLTPADAIINFDNPADVVNNFIRGMTTRPGAYTHFRGKKLKIYKCAVSPQSDGPDTPAGTILSNRKKLLVQCKRSVLELQRVVPEGKKEMDGVSFINGARPKDGESFATPVDEVERQV